MTTKKFYEKKHDLEAAMHSVISPSAMDLFPRWCTTYTIPFQLNSIN